ncbi:hypothetical protein ACFCX4_08940 [Kitasatospora sp. NPDC056327]|uniref:hypothetical protein n=1 Tax=Kitasatospora sp. NPDC056327 TaxID=3345785 RepID=UPI0035DC052F
MDHADREALRAAAEQRVRQQVQTATERRTRRARTRAALNLARAAGLTTRHRNRLTHLDNSTPAASAA